MSKSRAFVIIILFLTPVLVQAQMMDMQVFAPPAQQMTSVRAGFENLPKVSPDDKSNSTGMHQESLFISTPLVKTGTDVWTLSGNYSSMAIDTNGKLRNGSDVPGNFINESIGAGYAHHYEDKRFWAVNGSFGSASDQPFVDSSVQTIGANVFYNLPSSEASSWLFLVNYSNNRTILNGVPLPGFAFTYTPSKEFRGTIGVPFAFIRWEFVPKWTWTFLIAGLSKFKTEVAYALLGPIQVFTSLDFDQRAYFKKGRANEKERFFYEEKRASLGLKSPLHRYVYAELAGGYAYQRAFFEAENYQEKDDRNKMDIGDTWSLNFSLSSRF